MPGARRLRHLPWLLLVAVACAQIALARGWQLSPWLGGGFGMFSTTDAWARRHVHAYAIRPGVRRELDVTRCGGRALLRVLALPSDRHLRALTRCLAELPSPDEGPLEAIELQVWGVRYDRATLEPQGVLLRGWEMRPDGR